MVNNFVKAAAISVAAVFGAGAASAATLYTETVDFDELSNSGNNNDPYTSAGGFVFSPVNLNNDTKCEGDGGKCLGQENSQRSNVITNITFGADPFPSSTTDPQDNTDWSQYNSFNLLSFYFALVGSDSDIIVTGVFGDGTSVTKQYKVDDEAGTDFAVGEVTLAEPFNGAEAGDNADVLGNAQGSNGPFYFANLGTSFTNVKKVFFYSDQDSNVRLDCVGLEAMLSSAQDPSSCGTSSDEPPVVPLPAAGWMLLAGVGGLAAMRRRKKKS